MERRYGYCCINLSLAKDKISTNRGMVKKTFEEKGIAYASELALKNVMDLSKILQWNGNNGIKMYRMSSDIFPWCSEYEIRDLRINCKGNQSENNISSFTVWCFSFA
jgi:UV DNA damage endonuclease